MMFFLTPLAILVVWFAINIAFAVLRDLLTRNRRERPHLYVVRSS